MASRMWKKRILLIRSIEHWARKPNRCSCVCVWVTVSECKYNSWKNIYPKHATWRFTYTIWVGLYVWLRQADKEEEEEKKTTRKTRIELNGTCTFRFNLNWEIIYKISVPFRVYDDIAVNESLWERNEWERQMNWEKADGVNRFPRAPQYLTIDCVLWDWKWALFP